MVDEWNRDALLAPIGEQQTGEDLSFSLVVDEIREARRADPVYLNQGEWQSDLKRADWNAVIALSAKALAEQSKDVMIAGWLCEGLSHRDAFRGMAFGLGVISALCETYWERLYPQLDDGEEERLGRFTWLDDTLAAMRYLCATEPAYLAELSDASVHSLNLQGGPMNEAEMEEFAQNRNLQEILRVRKYDDAGKQAGLKTPPFAHYAPMIARVVAAHSGSAGTKVH